jgi:hypothetical protein
LREGIKMKKPTVPLSVCPWLVITFFASALTPAQLDARSPGRTHLTPPTQGCQPCPEVHVILLEGGEHTIRIAYHVPAFTIETVQIDGEAYYRPILQGQPHTTQKGMPDLPFVCHSVIIPEDSRMRVQVTGSTFTEYRLPIAPSRGLIPCDVWPGDVAYEFAQQYALDEFYPRSIAQLGSPYTLRDFRGVAVRVHPFAYNPRTQTLRHYSEIILEVSEVDPVASASSGAYDGRCNRFFSSIYGARFLNYEVHRSRAVPERGRMIVISHSSFLDATQPYVNWKRRKGIPTDLYAVEDIGATASDIKAFIQSEYDADNGLTFVQLVGDAEQIPTFLIERDFCSGLATSDASYALLDGDDSYPDIFVGRFSAQTVAEVDTQVERTIYYERDLSEGEWLHKGTGLGSCWGEGYGYMGLRDRDLVETLRLMLLGYTYTEVDQLYESGDPPGCDSVPTALFVSAVNEGRGIVNAEGHGDCEATFMIPPGGEYGDLFTADEVYDLLNDYALPFMSLSVPYVGNFQIDETYAEAWLRARTGSGAPIGAVAVYASSTDLDYASPQAAQYAMVDLLVTEQMKTVGGLMYNGACYAIDLYGDRGEKTFKSYHIFGDASLQVRTDTPGTMDVAHEPTIALGTLSFDLTVAGVEGALCALSRDCVLLGVGYTDETGHAVIELDEPVSGGEPLDLVVSAYNKVTYSTSIEIVPCMMVGDVDCDGDTDLDDYGFFTGCLGGPHCPNPGCDPVHFVRADLDWDSDLDLVDFGLFQEAFGE